MCTRREAFEHDGPDDAAEQSLNSRHQEKLKLDRDYLEIPMNDSHQQEQRILAAIGDVDVADAFRRWHRHLSSRLALPCDVTGIENFQWEEFYVVGPGDKAQYQSLQQNRPSYRDVFELTSLKAHVRRKNDGKRFVLGLSELQAKNKDSQNYQVLHDYAVCLVDSR